MEEGQSTFGYWLKWQVQSLRITQTEFATRIGRSQGAVSKWLSNRELPSPSSVGAIAKVLNVPEEEVLEAIRRSESHPANVHMPLIDLLAEIEDRIPTEVRVQMEPPTGFSNLLDPDYEGIVFLPYIPVDRIRTRIDMDRFRAFITSERFMGPLIQPGDLVILDFMTRIEPVPGDIILVAGDVFIEPDILEKDKRTGKRRLIPVTQPRDVDRELVRLVEIKRMPATPQKDTSEDPLAMKVESVADGEIFTGYFPDDYWGRVVTTIRDFNHEPGEERDWFRNAIEENTAKRQEIRRRISGVNARSDRH